MAASDYAPIFFKNRLHLAGRPQMSTQPSSQDDQARAKRRTAGAKNVIGTRSRRLFHET